MTASKYVDALAVVEALGTIHTTADAFNQAVAEVLIELASDVAIAGGGTSSVVAGEGTAGSPVGGVLSVQGVAGGTVLPVSAAALPLPSGAASSAKQDTGNTALTSIDAKLANPLPVSGTVAVSGTTAVSAASLPLPSGAASSAKQDTAQTSLSAIAASVAGTVAVSAASLPHPSGAATSAAQTAAQTSLSAIAASVAGTVAVSAASLPLPSGAATAANQTSANSSLSSIDTKLTNPLPVSGTLTSNPTKGSTATPANVSTSTSVATLVASNANRIGLKIWNDSSGILYLYFAAAASATACTIPLAAGDTWEMSPREWTGIVTGTLSTGTGTARVTEIA